jgi:glucokinase
MVPSATVIPMSFPVLVGDIGGTNARFALLSDAHAEPKTFDPVHTGDFPDIETAVEDSVFAMTSVMPRSAVIAVAGPVQGEEIDLTNADWVIRPRRMMERLGVDDVVIVNDFEALALSLTSLDDDMLHAIGGGETEPNGPKVVLGPGTGLGVAGMIHANGIWVPIPGEGGHVSFGPVEADEFPVWQALEPEHGRISAEAVLSGRGLVRLYKGVAASTGISPRFTRPAEISDAGLAASDATARRTLELYCRLLGRIAGDLALTFMASGGIFIGGGIAPRLLPILDAGEFRSAFEAKAPHGDFLRSVPCRVITGERPALTGLAAYARAPALFGVSLEGRRWTR